MAKAKSKAKKITAKELEVVKELQQQINTLIMNLGNAVLVQQQLSAKHNLLQADWKENTEKLEKKYGNVNISLQDGTISEIEEEEAATK